MKKLLFAVGIAVFGFTSVNAQEDESTFGFAEGDIFIEGNVGFNSSKDTDALDVETKTNGFSFNPKAGYLITDQFAVGVELAFAKNKREQASVIEQDVSAFGGGVFARYYFFELGKRFKTYSELGIGYATAKNKYPVGTETATETDKIINAGLDLGANFFVTENIAITFGLMDILSISNTKSDAKISGTPGDISSSGTDVNFGFGNVNNPFSNVSFGVLFKL